MKRAPHRIAHPARHPNRRSSFAIAADLVFRLGLLWALLAGSLVTAATLDQFVVFGDHRVIIHKDSRVTSGAVGSNHRVDFKKDTRTEGEVYAHRLHADKGSVFGGAVHYNHLRAARDVRFLGERITPLALPVLDALSPLQPFTQNPTDVTTRANETRILEPDDYDRITIGAANHLIFTGGRYNIRELSIARNTRVTFEALTVVQIERRFDLGRAAHLASVPGVTAADVVFWFGGSGKLRIGRDSRIEANFIAPTGIIEVAKDTALTGALLARRVEIAKNVVLTRDSAFTSDANTPPVADAGPDQTVLVGETVTLDGSGSDDVDGDLLRFDWDLLATPPDSAAALDDPAAVMPTFTVDRPGEYQARLIVDDGLADSDPDTVTITTDNSPPVADAGPDQTVFVGDPVQLDGSASSDVDGDPLGFVWALTTAPAGSAATLSDPAAVMPEFTVDLPGTYVAQLIVDDGTVASDPDTVTVITRNSPPVADAGPDQAVFVGDTVTLDGSASRDADSDPLTYAWAFTALPEDSTAALSDPAALAPSFAVDQPGLYVIQLMVNDGTADSDPDEVVVSTLNARPVAEAGDDQSVFVGDTVTLDGSASSDADGDALEYAWSLTSVPTGSTAALDDPNAFDPAFTADLPGLYVAQLIVSDGVLDSDPDTVTITTGNSPPVADAGPDQTVAVGDTVTLDGSGSFDPDDDPLGYQWNLVDQPTGSTATLADAASSAPSFVADAPGDYVVELVVDDGDLASAPDQVTITAAAANNPPEITSTPPLTAMVGQLYRYDVEADDPDGDTLNHGLLSAPVGMTIVAGGGLIEWTPATAQTVTVLTEANDGRGGFDRQRYTLNITDPNNDPPQLDPIADQILLIGQQLQLVLRASDPDNDLLSYTVSPLPLPANASFDTSSGVFTFQPNEGQGGVYALRFSVSDGELGASQPMTLTVQEPDPQALTRFSGRLLDANDAAVGIETPIVGAVVGFLGTTASATTDANGVFSIVDAPVGLQVLDIDPTDADPAPDGTAYAGYRNEKYLFPNIDNAIARPFYLPRIDTASVTPVDPDQTIQVTNPGLGVALTVAPHTAKNPDGTDYTGELSISTVPRGFTPGSMPPELDPGLIVTIQPVGVSFASPAPIRFPNTDNLPPGSEVDLWSLDPATGMFAIVGVGRVSADGQVIETISGGVRASDWHFVLPPELDGEPEDDEDNEPPCEAAGFPAGSIGFARSGCLSTRIDLPDYFSLGQGRGLSLVYRSDRAHPHPVVPFNITIPVRSTVPPTISYRGSFGGSQQFRQTYIDTSDLSENQDEILRAAVGFDAARNATGIYPYTVRVTSNFASSRVSSSIQGDLIVVNERDSVYGAGWGLSSVARLYEQANGDILLGGGDGTVTRFDFLGAADNPSLKFDGNDLVWFGATPPQSTHTLEAWVRAESPPGQFAEIVSQVDRGTGCGQGTAMRLLSDGRVWYSVDPAGCGGRGSANVYSDPIIGSWTHVAAAYDGAMARLYINGELVGQSQGRITPTQWLMIGGKEALNFFRGAIDEVRLWRIARSAQDIQATLSTALTGNEPGLSGYWPMNEGSGQQVSDAGPGGLNGVLGRTGAVEGQDPEWQPFGAPLGDCVQGSTCQYGSVNGDFSTFSKNPDGSFTRTLTNGTRYEYDSTGLQTAMFDRNGNTTTYFYNAAEQLVRIVDPVGRETVLTYLDGRLHTVTDPAGRTTAFEHDAAGGLRKVTFPDGSFKTFAYDDRYLMVEESNARGDNVYREYDAGGRLTKSFLPDGALRSFTNVHSVGLVDPTSGPGTAANPAPVVRPEAVLSTYTDGEGHVRIVKVNRFGAADEITDANGIVTRIERNADNLPIRTLRAVGTTEQSVLTRTYNTRGDVLSAREEYNGAETAYSYHPRYSLVTSMTDARGHGTIYTRDPDTGNLLAIRNPLGHTTTIVPNARGQIASLTTPNGVEMDYQYYPDGQLQTLTETPPAGGGAVRVTRFGYDAAGQLETLTTPGKITLDYDYDLRGRLIQISDTLNQRIVYHYDADGNLTGVDTFDPNNTLVNTLSRTFDALDRPLATLLPHRGGEVAEVNTYDLNGTLNTVTDARLNVTEYRYDPGDRLEQRIDARSGITDYAYDANDNLALVRAPNGAATVFDYDPLSRPRSETSPDRGRTDYGHDLTDNLISRTDGRGIMAEYSYDALNRVTAISYPDASENVSFIYDNCPSGTGRLCRRTDDSGVYDYHYDAYGNLTQVDFTTGGVTFTTAYAYDSGHRLASLTLPGGRVIEYRRDALQRIETIDTTVNGTPVTLVDSISYRADGRLVGQMFGNGLSVIRDYDLQGRLQAMTLGSAASPLERSDYDYDVMGNIERRRTEAQDYSYSYDALERLTDQQGGTTLHYAYDANGNRLASLINGQSRDYAYAIDSNRLIGLGGASLSHDEAGHLVQDGQGRSLVYNDAGRLAEVSDSSGRLASYRYNADGQRTHKITAARTVIYHYDRQGRLIAETLADGTPLREYIWLNGEPLAQIDIGAMNERLTYLHTDHIGTPWLGTDAGGTLVWRWQGRAFGDMLPDEDPDLNGQVTVVNLRFPGQYFDAETGLHYNVFRDYDPETGRYVQSDPIGLHGGSNSYAYANLNPLKFIDPNGLKSRVCCRLIPGIGAFGFRHCYIETQDHNGRSTYGLIGGAFSRMPGCGQIFPGNDFDTGGVCGPWTDSCDTDECVREQTDDYNNPSSYSYFGPNSNTFAGTVARRCNLKWPNLPPLSTPSQGDAPAPPYPGVPQVPASQATTVLCPAPPPPLPGWNNR